jgi:transcriptional regulator with XRE-family HTH domain
MGKHSKNQVLLRALEIAGSREQLAKKLGVLPGQLRTWLSGSREVPDRVFLAAVDIVLTATPHRGSPEDGGPAPTH